MGVPGGRLLPATFVRQRTFEKCNCHAVEVCKWCWIPPVASDVKDPNVSVVPSGFVTFTVSFAIGHRTGHLLWVVVDDPEVNINFLSDTDWIGETLMKEYVGMFNGGVCALALGNSSVGVPIEIINKTAIEIAIVLCKIFIFFTILF